MYKVIIDKKEFSIEVLPTGKTLNGNPFAADINEISKKELHILHNNKSFTVEVLESNSETKTFLIKVNNHVYKTTVKDKYDELLHEMGFDTFQAKRGSDIKAPMPGLVLNVNVQPGQQIKIGEPIVILEAMKMENVLKAHTDGTVKKVFIIKGDKVEKNQIMVTFE